MKSISLNIFATRSVIMLLVVCLLVTVPTWGQTGGDFELSRSTIGYASGQSSGGDFMLTSVIGQPDAGVMTGGDYEMLGGFLPGRPVCTVEFHHFARLAEYWLEIGCEEPDWCGGADLNHLGSVDLVDLSLFIDEWLDYCPTDWPLK